MDFNQELVNKDLDREDQPSWVATLQTKLNSMVKRSRSRMSTFHQSWENIDKAFRLEKPEQNEADRKASERDEPERFTLPFLYSQMQTFISIGESLLGDREVFFELAGSGAEDVMPSLLATSLLERDIEHSDFKHTGLKQFLTNAVRYDIAPIKYSWTTETEMMDKEVPLPGGEQFGIMQTVSEEVESFKGNKVQPISPYRFLPDPRVPVYRCQSGEFCGDDFFRSKADLSDMGRDGKVFGMKYVKETDKTMLDRVSNPFESNSYDIAGSEMKNQILVTELQFKMAPAKFNDDDDRWDNLLGDEEDQVTFIAWIANDNRIIRLERLGYPNNNFTYTVGVMSPDEQNFLGAGYAAILWPVQETADWFINSRVESVRAHVDKQFFIDPSAFNVQDITNRAKVVRLKPSVQMTDIRRYLYEPTISDASASNVADANMMFQFAKEGTGLTDNLIGQFASGRRSAKEAGNVHANAVQRVKSDIKTLWHTGLKPLGKAMLDNHRLGLDTEQIVRIVGVTDYHREILPTIEAFKGVRKEDIPARYDFRFTEALLPSEKQAAASTLQEVVLLILQNPQAAQLLLGLGYNMGKMVEELLRLKGLTNVSRFKLSQQELNRVSQLLATPPVQQAQIGTQGAGAGGNDSLAALIQGNDGTGNTAIPV